MGSTGTKVIAAIAACDFYGNVAALTVAQDKPWAATSEQKPYK